MAASSTEPSSSIFRGSEDMTLFPMDCSALMFLFCSHGVKPKVLNGAPHASRRAFHGTIRGRPRCGLACSGARASQLEVEVALTLRMTKQIWALLNPTNYFFFAPTRL